MKSQKNDGEAEEQPQETEPAANRVSRQQNDRAMGETPPNSLRKGRFDLKRPTKESVMRKIAEYLDNPDYLDIDATIEAKIDASIDINSLDIHLIDSLLSAKPTPDARTKWQEHIHAALAAVPDAPSYHDLAQNLEGLGHDFRRQVAARLLPALKDEMQRRPHATFDEKKALVQWVNAELRRFGFAIKSPKSERAALLTTDAGHHPDEGRFRLAGESDDGNRLTYSTSKLSDLLDNLVLIDAPLRREALAELRRGGRHGGGARRG